MNSQFTREQWLNRFAEEAHPFFEAAGHPLPENVRISIGFTSGGTRGKSIGECWGSIASRDGHFEIFLRPSLDSDSRVADVLTHELVHAAVGLQCGHSGAFKRCAVALGLGGKMTATMATDAWRAWADPILDALGPMPGAPLQEMRRAKPKQGTRMIKCECDQCGFIFRTSRSHLLASLRCPDPDCDGQMQF